MNNEFVIGKAYRIVFLREQEINYYGDHIDAIYNGIAESRKDVHAMFMNMQPVVGFNDDSEKMYEHKFTYVTNSEPGYSTGCTRIVSVDPNEIDPNSSGCKYMINELTNVEESEYITDFITDGDYRIIDKEKIHAGDAFGITRKGSTYNVLVVSASTDAIKFKSTTNNFEVTIDEILNGDVVIRDIKTNNEMPFDELFTYQKTSVIDSSKFTIGMRYLVSCMDNYGRYHGGIKTLSHVYNNGLLFDGYEIHHLNSIVNPTYNFKIRPIVNK